MNTFKIVIIGDGGVGKTTYINRLLTDEFEKKYVATLGVEVDPLRFNTSHGDICFNMWDCAGQEKFGGLRDGYFKEADAAIIMCDVTSSNTFINMGKWATLFANVCPNKPIIICANKVDIRRRVVRKYHLRELMERTDNKYMCFEISVKNRGNLNVPFIELARKLTNNENLTFN